MASLKAVMWERRHWVAAIVLGFALGMAFQQNTANNAALMDYSKACHQTLLDAEKPRPDMRGPQS